MNIFKIYASIQKEFLLLINDRVGLFLLFLMPLLLVFIITIIQDGAYKVVNENKIAILVVNHDTGDQGNKLVTTLTGSGLFEVDSDNNMPQNMLTKELLSKGKMLALFIPENFTKSLVFKAEQISSVLMKDLGLETVEEASGEVSNSELTFYHDPVLQENYSFSIKGIIQSYTGILENNLMIESMYTAMDLSGEEGILKKKMIDNRVNINQVVAMSGNSKILPNATQHNVPAWTIFAMYFMVVSLGSNLVKERNNGSFLRLKTMPTSFVLVMFSKMLIYVMVAVLQVALTFSMGIFILPHLGLPTLTIPTNLLAFVTVVLVISMSAVSYALMIGSFAKTQEQANGFGAISIIIFGAIGGILVPTFVMPSYLQLAAVFSPLHWCLEGFYILFLKDGSWHDLSSVLLFLGIFIIICQLCCYYKLKLDKII